MNQRCSIGSFVEIRKDSTIDVGIVTTPQTGLFSHKTISMVNADGQIVQFEPSDVSFHLASLFNIDRLEPFDIHSTISNFVKLSMETKRLHEHLIPMAQAWYSKEDRTVEIDLLSVSKIILKHSKRPNILSECLLYGLHLHLSSHPYHFRLETNKSRSVLESMTSDSIPVTHYFANSINLSEELLQISFFEYKILQAFQSNLRKLKHDEANILNKYKESENNQDPQFIEINLIVSFLTYYKTYPHPDLRPTIGRLLGDLFFHTSSGVSKVLDLMGVKTQLTLSEAQFSPVSEHVKDHFNHLRFTNTSKVYLLPSPKLDKRGLLRHSEIGLSLEKGDCWKFNIYIPDVAAHISRNSKLTKNLLTRVSDLDLTTALEPLLVNETVEDLAFRDGKECHALTISINYPVGTEKPWYKTSTSVRLERLVNVQYVPLKDLNELWRSRFPVLSDILNMFMSNEYEVLQSEDRNSLLNMLSMIDYWCLKRGKECSMDQHFPRRDILSLLEMDENEGSVNFLDYIISELKTIASHHTLQWAKEKQIPLLIQSQKVLEPLNDTFYVESSSLIVPSYDAHNYQELTFLKDRSGLTPIANYFAAISFLSPVSVGTTRLPFSPLGLREGFTNICEGLSDMESIVNQWQIICDLQSKFVMSQRDYRLGVTTLFKKGFRVMSKEELQSFYDLDIAPLKRANLSLEQKAYESTVFQTMRSRDEEQWVFLQCIAVRDSEYPQVARAYCHELGLELDVLLSKEFPEVHCGDQLICNRVISLTSDQLILRV
jgi:hypothetical protein